MMLQSGFFDLQDRFSKIDQMGDLLKALNEVIGWSIFEPILTKGLAKEKKNNAGRPSFEALLMFKVLILQSLYNFLRSIRALVGCNVGRSLACARGG